MSEALLSVRDLSVDFVGDAQPVHALERISLEVRAGEVLGIAGESGSGKSTLAQAVLRILPPPGVIVGGSVVFEGRNLLALSDSELRAVRWERLSMVFQSAMDALNPSMTVGEQLIDTLRAHRPVSVEQARSRAVELLELVGIPTERLGSFPHQLSCASGWESPWRSSSSLRS